MSKDIDTLLQAGFKPSLVADRSLIFEEISADALGHLQSVLQVKDVEVGLAGSASLTERSSMLFVAGQAIIRKVTGLSVEGLEGKFKMPTSVELDDIKELFSNAGGALAEAEVRSAVPAWANGKPTYKFSDLVPESVGRILRGGLSKDGIEIVADALQSGVVKDFGSKQGKHIIGKVFEERGVRLDAQSIEAMATSAGFKVSEPDRQRGNYFGAVVAVDHRASAIKWSRDSVMILPHKDLPDGAERPHKGEVVRLKFTGGTLALTKQAPQNAKESSAGR